MHGDYISDASAIRITLSSASLSYIKATDNKPPERVCIPTPFPLCDLVHLHLHDLPNIFISPHLEIGTNRSVVGPHWHHKGSTPEPSPPVNLKCPTCHNKVLSNGTLGLFTFSRPQTTLSTFSVNSLPFVSANLIWIPQVSPIVFLHTYLLFRYGYDEPVP